MHNASLPPLPHSAALHAGYGCHRSPDGTSASERNPGAAVPKLPSIEGIRILPVTPFTPDDIFSESA
jgi:hypothetical protein